MFEALKMNLLSFPHEAGCLVVGLRPTVRMWDLGLQGECPPLEVFYGILARIYSNFGENQGKLRTARSTSCTKV